MRILLIRFDVFDVTFCFQEVKNFVKVSHDQKGFSLTCEKWMSDMNFAKNRQRYRDTVNYYQNDQRFSRRATICCISINERRCSDNESRYSKGSVVFR